MPKVEVAAILRGPWKTPSEVLSRGQPQAYWSFTCAKNDGTCWDSSWSICRALGW